MNINKKQEHKNKKNTGGGPIFAPIYAFSMVLFMFYVYNQMLREENSVLKDYMELVFEKYTFKYFLIALGLSYIIVAL